MSSRFITVTECKYHKERIGDILSLAWQRQDFQKVDLARLLCGLSHFRNGWDFQKYPLTFFLPPPGHGKSDNTESGPPPEPDGNDDEMSIETLCLNFKALRQLPPSQSTQYVPEFHQKALKVLKRNIPEDYRTSLLLSAAMCEKPISTSSKCTDERVEFFSSSSSSSSSTIIPEEVPVGDYRSESRDLCLYLGRDRFSPRKINPYYIDAYGSLRENLDQNVKEEELKIKSSFLFLHPSDYTHNELSYETLGKFRRFKEISDQVIPIRFDRWRQGIRPEKFYPKPKGEQQQIPVVF